MPTDLAGADLVPVYDLSGPHFPCGSTPFCLPGTKCCVTANVPACTASCTGGMPVECRGPDYCGGNPCCLTLDHNQPTSVVCTDNASACPENFTLNSGTQVSGTTRLCNLDGDCSAGLASTTYPDCCTAQMGALSQKICFNKGYVSLTGGTITCP
jgi:hypothetical protein